MLADSAPEPQSESSRTLARLNYADGNFYVAQGDRQGAGQSSPPEKVWLVVRSLRGSNGTKGYCLQEGDIVKLGRVKLRVKELCGPITTSGGRRSGSMETDTAAATQSPPGAAPVSRLTRASVTSRASVASNMSGPAAGDASDDDDEYFLADDQLDGALAADPSQAVVPPHAVEPPVEPAPVAPSEPEDPNAALACRICLCDTPEPNNPLISPCRCKGTMKLVHLQCLRSWVEGRLNLNTSGGGVASTFFWRTLDCELCKVPYPNHVDVDGQQIELFEIPKPQAPYIVLESLSRDRSNTNRGIHVISLADRPVVRLGRGHDSDVRVSDISVSRCHATIRYVRDGFYLEDNISKFGTLVQVKRPVRLDTSTTMAIQVGRTVISFAMRRPWNFLPACLRPVMAPGPDAHNPPSSTS